MPRSRNAEMPNNHKSTIPSTLIRYRYWILAALSLLLMSEMALAWINIIPAEYEWGLGGLLFLTAMAWVTAVGLIGIVAPMERDPMEYVYFFLAVLSAVLFTMLVSPLLLEPLDSVFWQRPLLFLLTTVWMGLMAIVGATSNAERNSTIHTRLIVFPLLVIAWSGLLVHYWVAFAIFDVLLLLPSPYALSLLSLFVVLSNSLTLGVLLLRTMLVNKPRTTVKYVVVALTALGISAFTYAIAVGLGLLSIVVVGLGFAFIVIFLVASLSSVLGTMAIGTMRRPIRNITVAGIGMVGMIIVVGWCWYWTMDNGLDAFAGEEHAAAERVLSRASCPGSAENRRVFKGDDGEFLVRGYTWWRLPTGDCRIRPE